MQIGQKNRTRKKKGSFGICLHNGNNQSIALKNFGLQQLKTCGKQTLNKHSFLSTLYCIGGWSAGKSC